jgi:hypothetical protein
LIDADVARATYGGTLRAHPAHASVPPVARGLVRRNVRTHDPELRERAGLIVPANGLTTAREDRDDPLTIQCGWTVVHYDRREEELASDALAKGSGQIRVHFVGLRSE